MPMQWGSKGATSNILAGQFPQFQISAADVKRGAVVVNATSPSGKTHRMTVQEKNGVYTANFTPTEVGEYFGERALVLTRYWARWVWEWRPWLGE